MAYSKRRPGLFALFGIAVVALYGVLEWRGANLLPTTEHSKAPSAVRGSSGGYRSYYRTHGFHGGK